jgi:serine protease Do
MLPFLRRTKIGVAVVSAFLGGLIVASSLDLTRFGYAQSAAPPTSQEVRALNEQSNAFVSIAEHVTPAVVSIQTERDPRMASTPPRQRGRTAPPGLEEFFNQFDQRRQEPVEGSGSGFIVSKDGYILTNNHVVADADRLTVTLTDHRVFRAKVVGRDPSTDVAVIKIEGSDLPTVGFGSDAGVRIGEWVLAIGNPLGLDFTVTAGIVSAKGRGGRELGALLRDRYAISDFIQTDAAINPGNSGGPLVNTRGEVIGINSAIASPTGFYSGYGFAIPVSLARDVMDDLIKYGRVRRAVLGIGIEDVAPEDAQVAGLKRIEGVKVGSYSPPDDSPAKRAGIEPGDVIVAADGKPVDRVSSLQRIVRGHEPGETIEIEVMRYGQRRKFKVKLMEAPSEQMVARAEDPETGRGEGVSSDKLGIAVEPVSAEFARETQLGDPRGLRIADVTPSGPSHSKLFENDVILEVLYPLPRRTVRTAADLQKVLDRVNSGDVISLSVWNAQGAAAGQSTRVVNLRIGG